MGAVSIAFIQSIVKFLIFFGLAFAGIKCGKMFRDKKEAKKQQ